MKIFKKVVIGYVFYTSPLIFLLILYIIIKNPNFDSPPPDGFPALLIVLGFQGLIWTLASLGLTISMFFSQSLRNTVLARLSGIKERDEREIQIASKALKSSYLTSMTILLCLLSISLIQITVGKISADSLGPGELPGYISIGFKIKLSDPDAIITQKEDHDWIFQYNDVPLSTLSLIILLILWQIVSYRYVSRRSLKLPDCPDAD